MSLMLINAGLRPLVVTAIIRHSTICFFSEGRKPTSSSKPERVSEIKYLFLIKPNSALITRAALLIGEVLSLAKAPPLARALWLK